MYTQKFLIFLCFYVYGVLCSVFFSEALLLNLSNMNSAIGGNIEKIPNAMKELRMIFYNGSSNATFSNNFTFEQSKDMMRYINASKPLVLYIHGFEENPFYESIQTVVSANVRKGSDNIIVLDWSSFAFGNYIPVALRTKVISRYTADTMLEWVKAGMKTDSLHVIGHSLGAQIAGFMGQYLNFSIPRVTALCSHWRSWRFYAESVVNNTAFPTLQCGSYKSFLQSECSNNEIVYFGYSMPRNASGNYYFF